MTHQKLAKSQASTLNNSYVEQLFKKIKKGVSSKRFLLVAAIMAGALLLIPAIRQRLTAQVWKKTVHLVIEQAGGDERVSLADVSIGGRLLQSNQTGEVQVSGLTNDKLHIVISKPFYADYATTVSLSPFKRTAEVRIQLKPLGSIAKVSVINALNNHPLAGVRITTDVGAKGFTGQDGVAKIMLPKTAASTSARLEGPQIITTKATVWTADNAQANIVHAVPKGTIYYLTADSGSVSVVKSNLDGSAAKVVAANLGKAGSVQMLAAKNWQYLAVTQASDDGTHVKLLNAANDSFTEIDVAPEVQLTGWQDDWLVYRTVQSGAPPWQKDRVQLKSYNAKTRTTTILETTHGEGSSVLDYVAMEIPDVFLINGTVLYTTHWGGSYYYGSRFTGKNMLLVSIKPDGTNRGELHSWPAGYDTAIHARPGGVSELYLHVELDGVQHSYWQYINGTVRQNDSLGEDFLNGAYHSLLDSPNSFFTLWAEPQNSQYALYVGDHLANNRIKLAERTAYVPYGWYTNDYVLLFSDSGELKIVGREGIKPGLTPLKVANVVRPNNDVHGYGEGYQR